LVDEARSRGRQSDKGIVFELVLTNQQISARIGTVREVVSRALSRLQQNELIVVSARVITILDEEALRAFAGE
jgi:CRP/FNR family transcriptional regulator